LLAIRFVMMVRPIIFISAVSKELRSARQLVANTLELLGYDPDWQDIFGTEEGDLREMLRRKVDASAGVVQLVGQCYGAEPGTPDAQFGRVSYTQYEALYGKERSKRVWYMILDENFTADPHEAEPEEQRALQVAYRERIREGDQLYHPLGNSEELENKVLKLRDDLAALRRRGKQWAAGVVALLILIAGLVSWVIKHEVKLGREQVAMNAKMDKILEQGIAQFVSTEAKVRQAQPGQKPQEIEERTYEDLSKTLGIDVKTLRENLPQFARELKDAPTASTYERANAAYVAKDYNESERLALAAADEAQKASPPRTADAIKAFELAGQSADARGEFDRALEHYSAAVELGEKVLGPEDPVTLKSRYYRANVLAHQGRYPEAENEYRAVIKLQEEVLGPKDPNTLGTRNGLANALTDQHKNAEAENEYRAVIKLQEEVLGPEHPDTLGTRNNLASALADQDKYAEAESEFRAVIKLQEKVLGPEHRDTLGSRYNLATAFDHQGEYAHAENEYRAVLKLEEELVGPEDPDTLTTRNGLAWLLATCSNDKIRNGREAVELATKVCELSKWSNAGWVDTLAAAEAEAGLFDAAVKHQKQAIELAKAANSNTKDYEQHINLYRQHKPYREMRQAR
jgi:tetratricopeptide (TPR) repeat protein